MKLQNDILFDLEKKKKKLNVNIIGRFIKLSVYSLFYDIKKNGHKLVHNLSQLCDY